MIFTNTNVADPSTRSAMKGWADRYGELVEADPFLEARRQHYLCQFGLDMGAADLTVHMHRGRIEELHVDAGPFGPRREFVIRASADTWMQMARAVPPPGFQGIFAALAAHDLSIDGNVGTLLQHLTCVIRQIELLRVVGVPPVVRQAASTHFSTSEGVAL